MESVRVKPRPALLILASPRGNECISVSVSDRGGMLFTMQSFDKTLYAAPEDVKGFAAALLRFAESVLEEQFDAEAEKEFAKAAEHHEARRAKQDSKA